MCLTGMKNNLEHGEEWHCSLYFIWIMGLLSAHSAEKTAPLVEYVIIPSQKSPFYLEIQDSPDKLRLVTKYPVVEIDCCAFFKKKQNIYWWCFASIADNHSCKSSYAYMTTLCSCVLSIRVYWGFYVILAAAGGNIMTWWIEESYPMSVGVESH